MRYIKAIITFRRLYFMRFKKVAVMVMAVSLFMTSFTAGSSYASANETADTQIEGMILKSENVNI